MNNFSLIGTDTYKVNLFGECAVRDAVITLSQASNEARGAIFTRGEVVDFILDLVGYKPDIELSEMSILEPSFGGGDFLVPIIKRLIASLKRSNGNLSVNKLSDCIRAVELHGDTYWSTRAVIVTELTNAGFDDKEADLLVDKWLVFGDFLLVPLEFNFDFIVGNPPYLRQEMIPSALIEEYRSRYKTIYDRADLYIPFFERSLKRLNTNGKLGFICADRWMKNRYGAPLRKLISTSYHLEAYVDMVGTYPFHETVSTYPAITIISNSKGNITRIARKPLIEVNELLSLAKSLTADTALENVEEIPSLVASADPWILDGKLETQLIRRLESKFPTIEEVGCKVGIGVATGADKVFIGKFDELNVEDSRKLPLAMTCDLKSGELTWQGKGVINPFESNGNLVELEKYPKLQNYLEANEDIILKRHVAKKNPLRWYRTIDKIHSEIATREKLLIPDIKGQAKVVYESGELYPHHNLYFIISDEWEMRALQAVLLSSVTQFFIETYSTKMRGGYLRYQAQYLRRLRLPKWNEIEPTMQQKLSKAAKTLNQALCDEVVFDLYKLTPTERKFLKTVNQYAT